MSILQVLWPRGEATVAEVATELSTQRELAHTTVATMLRKMEVRELVTHRVEGRSFLYRALVNADEVSKGMANHLVDRLCDGSLLDAVQHLLTTRAVSRAELSKIEKLIAERKKSL